MSDTMGQAFCLGFEDRHTHGLLRREQLYRRGPAQKAAWRIGREIANLLTRRPLRTAGKSAPTKGTVTIHINGTAHEVNDDLFYSDVVRLAEMSGKPSMTCKRIGIIATSDAFPFRVKDGDRFNVCHTGNS